jgi:N-acetylmuramoyl-L-alanine amidase
MRKIDNIVMHCTATAQSAKVESIVNYWKNNLKWKNPGYHFIIEADGTVHNLQPISKPSNGVRGHNATSIHISYIGGIDSKGRGLDNRTSPQKESQISILKELKSKFPAAKILGHRDFPGVKKECPSFDVESWLKEVYLE